MNHAVSRTGLLQKSDEVAEVAFVKELEPGVYRLMIWVQPGAKKDELAGIYQDRLKVRINAPAVDNKANKAVVKFLAKVLKVKKKQLELESGQTSRGKNILVKSEKEPCWADVAGMVG